MCVWMMRTISMWDNVPPTQWQCTSIWHQCNDSLQIFTVITNTLTVSSSDYHTVIAGVQVSSVIIAFMRKKIHYLFTLIKACMTSDCLFIQTYYSVLNIWKFIFHFLMMVTLVQQFLDKIAVEKPHNLLIYYMYWNRNNILDINNWWNDFHNNVTSLELDQYFL